MIVYDCICITCRQYVYVHGFLSACMSVQFRDGKFQEEKTNMIHLNFIDFMMFFWDTIGGPSQLLTLVQGDAPLNRKIPW